MIDQKKKKSLSEPKKEPRLRRKALETNFRKKGLCQTYYGGATTKLKIRQLCQNFVTNVGFFPPPLPRQNEKLSK